MDKRHMQRFGRFTRVKLITTDEQAKQSIEDAKTNELNIRLALIARIFGYDRFIGHDKKCLEKNKYYYNDMFDTLYDMPLPDLEEVDQNLHLVCEQFSKIITRYESE